MIRTTAQLRRGRISTNKPCTPHSYVPSQIHKHNERDNTAPAELSNLLCTSYIYWQNLVLPSSLRFQESIPHIYGMRRSSRGPWYKKLPQHHHHGGCLYQYTRLSDDTWERQAQVGPNSEACSPHNNAQTSYPTARLRASRPKNVTSPLANQDNLVFSETYTLKTGIYYLYIHN